MSNLTEYIKETKKYISKQNNMTETEIIRYIYLELGKKLSFDENYLPFGNSKKKQNIYKYHSKNISDLDNCMETNKAICKSISYILEYILKDFGIDVKTIIDPDDIRKCPHTYNIIKQKNGKQYSVDLQEDIYNIQSHSFTKNFGKSIDDQKTYVISRFEQEQMDRKLGYIDNDHYYADDYIYLLKYNASFIENFDARVKFILENIDIHDNPNIGYTDRQWHHKTVLEELFDKKDFDYNNNNGKIKMIDCYKDIKGERVYINCISVQTKTGTDIYIYNKNQYKYCKIDFLDFVKAVKKGLVVHNSNIQGLNNALKKSNEFDER